MTHRAASFSSRRGFLLTHFSPAAPHIHRDDRVIHLVGAEVGGEGNVAVLAEPPGEGVPGASTNTLTPRHFYGCGKERAGSARRKINCGGSPETSETLRVHSTQGQRWPCERTPCR